MGGRRERESSVRKIWSERIMYVRIVGVLMVCRRWCVR
jgi:hypothetical protein